MAENCPFYKPDSYRCDLSNINGVPKGTCKDCKVDYKSAIIYMKYNKDSRLEIILKERDLKFDEL